MQFAFGNAGSAGKLHPLQDEASLCLRSHLRLCQCLCLLRRGDSGLLRSRLASFCSLRQRHTSQQQRCSQQIPVHVLGIHGVRPVPLPEPLHLTTCKRQLPIKLNGAQ